MISEVAFDLAWAYEVCCTNIMPLQGVSSKRIYKAETESGDVVIIKEYDRECFDKNRLSAIEKALENQRAIQDAGFNCPYVYRTKNGGVMRYMNSSAYVVTSVANGKNESCGNVTLPQMKSLGENCGLLHKTFSKLPLNTVDACPADNTYLLEQFKNKYKECIVDFADMPDFFEISAKGIIHGNFTSANVLFDERGVSSVVNFDRCGYGFLWHDIISAISSFALRDGEFDIDKIKAFAEGYSKHMPF